MNIAATFAARSWIDRVIAAVSERYNPNQPEQFLRLSLVTVGKIRGYPATFHQERRRKRPGQQHKISIRLLTALTSWRGTGRQWLVLVFAFVATIIQFLLSVCSPECDFD
jgi:hypothetical protein